jgi:hypothetical protein
MYAWAMNKIKLQRAEAMTPGGNEEAIKEAYIKLGGGIADVPAPVETPVVEETTAVEPVEEAVEPESTNDIKDVETPVVAPKTRKPRTKK